MGAKVTPTVALLGVHAYGSLGDAVKLAEAHGTAVAAIYAEPVARLRDELIRRYVKGLPERHDDDWVFHREVEALLIAG